MNGNILELSSLRTGLASLLQNSPSTTGKVRWVCWPFLKISGVHPSEAVSGEVWGAFYIVLGHSGTWGSPTWNTRWMQRKSVAEGPCQDSSCQGLGPVCLCAACWPWEDTFCCLCFHHPDMSVSDGWGFSRKRCACIANSTWVSVESPHMGMKQNYVWVHFLHIHRME